MREINLKKLMKEVEDESKDDAKTEECKSDIIRCINDSDTTGFALLFTTDKGGGTIGAISNNVREKMAKTALYLVADLAKKEVMDNE